MLYHPTYGYVLPLQSLNASFTLCLTRAGQLALGTRTLRKPDPHSNLHP